MKKFVSAFILVAVLFAGCGHTHEWENATCRTAKTCKSCGETEGEPLEHIWVAATCEEARHCSDCGTTEGAALGHAWVAATCTTKKMCSVCGAEEGKALGHDATGVTCTNDDVCKRCGVTIAAFGHTWTDATCEDPKTCSVCGAEEGKALGHTADVGVCGRCGWEGYKKVTGKGDDVNVNVAVGDGIYRVHFTHSGRSNFIVHSYDATGDKEYLINEIGKYDGYVLLLGESPYTIEIEADGSWSYTIERLTKTNDIAFSGKGDYVTGLCSISSGVWKFTHDGDSNFIVHLYTTEGRDYLINEIGEYSGKKLVEVPAGSYAFFEIEADGDWTIEKG